MSEQPLVDWAGSKTGALVRIDERNGTEAIKLLHDAYYALGKGFWDDGQQFGKTYEAIAEFLYPEAIDANAIDHRRSLPAAP